MSAADADTARNVLFAGKLANAEVLYVEVPIHDKCIGLHVAWPDSTSSATIVLELGSYRKASATVAGAAKEWKDSGVSITGPAASAAGAVLVNVSNVMQKRARLKITAAAVTNLEILDGLAPEAA